MLKNILPFVLPYRWLIAITLVLTLVGSLMAQVNAVVLDRAVDAINALVSRDGGFAWGEAVRILTVISVALLGLMFAANVYVGLVALCIVPLYFRVTYVQACRMKGGRRGIFGGHQAVSQGI